MWLGNNRGTLNSRRHVDLDADLDASEFWDFSHHEKGAFDLPTMAKKIIKENGSTCWKVNMLGHSLGNTQAYYGMGRGSYMQPYFASVLALAPCFVPNEDHFTHGNW